MRHGSLFSGIGGFDLAAQWMGWENVFHCEWNPFGQRLLKYYWPNAISYEDICATDFTVHRGSIDIVTGGFPCQPYSTAGKRLGKADERHLFPQMLRAIKEIKPRWVVGENVRGLVSWNGGLVFDEVCADLEGEGYEVIPFLLPAAGVNAPHRRDRVWFVAYSNKQRNTSCGAGQGIKRIGSANDGEQKERAEQTQRFDRLHGFLPDAPNANASQNTRSNGCIFRQPKQEGAEIREQWDLGAGDSEWICGEGMAGAAAYTESQRTWEQQSKDSGGEDRRFDNYGEVRHASDTNGIGLRGEGDRVGNTRFFGKNYKRNDWEAFPTVSPLCSRNDGLSDRLDGITFSKWRNESIKGGGNAVVPQIPYLIFKAIEAYETQTI